MLFVVPALFWMASPRPASALDFGVAVVSNASTVVYPAQGVTAAPAWAPNTLYANGAYVSSGLDIYMNASTASVSRATALTLSGRCPTNDTVTWVASKSSRAPRTALAVSYIAASGILYVNFGRPASSGKGIAVPAGATLTWTGPTVPQEEISVFPTTDGAVSIFER